MQIRLNRSRCRMRGSKVPWGYRSSAARSTFGGIMYRPMITYTYSWWRMCLPTACGERMHSPPRRIKRQDGDAASCQITLKTCLHYHHHYYLEKPIVDSCTQHRTAFKYSFIFFGFFALIMILLYYLPIVGNYIAIYWEHRTVIFTRVLEKP